MSFFFLLSLFFCLLNDVHRYYGCSESTKGFSGGGATTMTTGPNDARRVVWALGEFFILFSSCFFLYLMIYIGTTIYRRVIRSH